MMGCQIANRSKQSSLYLLPVLQGSKLVGVMAGHGGQAQYGHFLNIASEYCD